MEGVSTDALPIIPLADLNRMSQAEFTAALGQIFEDSPWVAAVAWADRPFATVSDLHHAIVRAVVQATPARQLRLIGSHPELALPTAMADFSRREQAGAGLDRLEPEEAAEFQYLNRAYRDRFGFPFIMAIRGCDKSAILTVLRERLQGDPAAEAQQALHETALIARFRLSDCVIDMGPKADHLDLGAEGTDDTP